MDHLWAPWRLSYVAAAEGQAATTGDDCFICRGLAGTDDRANLIVHRTALSVVVLNRFPYNNGHLLVPRTPTRAGSTNSTTDELLDLQLVLRQMIGDPREADERRTASTSG